MRVITYKVYIKDEDFEEDNCQNEESFDYIAMCYHNAEKIEFFIDGKLVSVSR